MHSIFKVPQKKHFIRMNGTKRIYGSPMIKHISELVITQDDGRDMKEGTGYLPVGYKGAGYEPVGSGYEPVGSGYEPVGYKGDKGAGDEVSKKSRISKILRGGALAEL